MLEEIPPRPILTLPEVEARCLFEAYCAAPVILEYGSGGSTVMASDMPDKRIFVVESDQAWVQMLQAWFAANVPASVPLLHHADIGPTRKWGYPVDETTIKLWPVYPKGIWEHPEFLPPDVVLIDGRFRLACLLTVALRTQKPVVVLLDDYLDRPGYHAAEVLLGQPAMIGRMARFDLIPGMIRTDRLRLVRDSYKRPL